MLLETSTILPAQAITVPAGYGYTTLDSKGGRPGVVDFA
jgi:hypothetical protein